MYKYIAAPLKSLDTLSNSLVQTFDWYYIHEFNYSEYHCRRCHGGFLTVIMSYSELLQTNCSTYNSYNRIHYIRIAMEIGNTDPGCRA